jgi:rhomboid family GlyGly-CTERM serine protease
LLAAAIVAASLPLLLGGSVEPLVFFPRLVAAGEWWRVLTHPFAHVSLYHLALDAGAFLLLYSGLQARAAERLALTACSAAGSLLAAFLAPGFAERGLCGLSGAAHGLMAVSALELMARPESRRAGLAALLLVAGKSLLEAATGSVLFAGLHLGYIGAPIAVCHLGGVLGGSVACLVARAVCGRRPAGPATAPA